MNKKNRSKRTDRRKQNRRPQRSHHPVARPAPLFSKESRQADAITVAWMLSCLAAFVAEIAAVVVQSFALSFSASDSLKLLAGSLLFVATACGLVTLILTPITLRFRRVPPPQSIVLVAVVIGIAPIVSVLLLAIRGL